MLPLPTLPSLPLFSSFGSLLVVVVLVAVCLFTFRSKFTHTSAESASSQRAALLAQCSNLCVCVGQLQLRSVCCYNDFVVVVVVVFFFLEWELKIGMHRKLFYCKYNSLFSCCLCFSLLPFFFFVSALYPAVAIPGAAAV